MRKVYDKANLVITTADPFLLYPRYGILRILTIDAVVLLADILDPARSGPLYLALANVTYLSIARASDASSTLIDGVLQQFFDFLKGLMHLRTLRIEDFVLPNSSHPPDSLHHSPLSIRDLEVSNTDDSSLAFLLNSIRPQSLFLNSCARIHALPICASLTLQDINACSGLGDVLWRWNGRHLTIDSCSFLNEFFVEKLIQRMRAADRPLWPDVQQVSFEGCSAAVEGKMYELLDLRSQM